MDNNSERAGESMTDVRKMDGAELLDAVTRIYWIVEDGQERAKLIAEREAARQEAIRLIDLGRNVALFQPPADIARHLARHMAGMIVPESVAASEQKFHAYLTEELPRVMGAQLTALSKERDVLKQELRNVDIVTGRQEISARGTASFVADIK